MNERATIPTGLDATGLAVLLASIAISLLAAGPAPERLRIHWGSPYYGPEFAPAVAVLVGFPLATAACYLFVRAVSRVAVPEDAPATAHRGLVIGTAAALGCLLLTQVAVLGLNLL
jgi:hypothetical protein